MTSSVTWPFDSRDSTFYGWSIVTTRLSSTVMKIWRLEDNVVTSLTFWDHVTSSLTWPFDSRGSTFYGCSIVTMRLSNTVIEIWPFELLPGRLFQEQRSVLNITLIYVKKLTSLQLCVRTMWRYQSSKTAKIIWVTLDGYAYGILTSWL